MSASYKITCLLRDQYAHVKPVEEALEGKAEFTYDGDWDPAKLVSGKPNLILCVNDYHYDVARCIEAAKQAGIPTLTMQDGILEWRCQYENPLFGAGNGAPQHQPVLADKIACLGHASVRHIASWGNAAKVEVTGMPRLDALLHRKAAPIRKPGSRILVMTAKNPGFTQAQRNLTIQSLKDVRDYLTGKPGVQILWRVSKAVAQALEVENQLTEISTAELATVLDQADAVISSLSTAILEAMMSGRPVAALDYHNVPRFQSTAWTISSREQIGPVVTELLNPPANKIAFQTHCLADSLECSGSAAERVASLILKMIEQRNTLQPNMLGNGTRFQVFDLPPLAALYPNHAAFSDTETLQLRLARAENENRRLKDELSELRASRSVVGRLVKKLGLV
jgi:hypothetical protein